MTNKINTFFVINVSWKASTYFDGNSCLLHLLQETGRGYSYKEGRMK